MNAAEEATNTTEETTGAVEEATEEPAGQDAAATEEGEGFDVDKEISQTLTKTLDELPTLQDEKLLQEAKDAGLHYIARQIQWGFDLGPIRGAIPGANPSNGWKNKEVSRKVWKRAYDKMRSSKKYVFPNVSGFAGKVAAVLPEGERSLANAVCYRLWCLVAEKPLSETAVFVAGFVARVKAAAAGAREDSEFRRLLAEAAREAAGKKK